MKPSILLLLIISVIGSSSCNASQFPSSTAPNPEQGFGQPYPYPNPYPYPYPHLLEMPPLYPDPEAIPATPTFIPAPTATSDPTLGRVNGALFEGVSPVQISLYLAEVRADEDGTEVAARYNPLDSPRIETSADGSFSFVNVMPGRYALILYTGLSSYLLNIPDKQEAIVFTVEAGKTVNLGKIVYDDLPLE